jgi:putative endonuclease
MTDIAAWVYLLRCNDGSLYCGWTTDVDRRLGEHAAGKGGRYTSSHRPVALAAAFPMADATAARREEARIKRLRRPAKERLLAAADPKVHLPHH